MPTQFFSDGTRFIDDNTHNLTSILIKNINSPDAASLLTNIQMAINNISCILEEADVSLRYNESNFWNTIATSEIDIELSSFQLSTQILFEAVTFEFPINVETVNDWLVAESVATPASLCRRERMGARHV